MAKFKYEILIFVFFILIHLPALGHDNFTTDTFKWKSRSYDFGSGVFGLDFEKTIQKYHPGVTLMWMGVAGIKVNTIYYEYLLGTTAPDNNVHAMFLLDFFQKIFIVLTTAVCMSLIFNLLKEAVNLKFAALTTLLIIFEPFYLGLTRVMHLEGLMTTFMIVSILYLFKFLQDTKSLKPIIISGVFAALAGLTKSAALFLLPFTIMILVIDKVIFENGLRDSKENKPHAGLTLVNYPTIGFFIKEIFRNSINKKILKYIFIWIGTAVITCFLLWPALITHTGLALRTVYRGVVEIGVEGGHGQIYFGRFMENPGVTFYFVVLGFKSSIYLILGLVGFIFTYKKIAEYQDFRHSNAQRLVFYTVLFSTLYFIQILIPSKKLDRYILPSIVGFTILAGTFYYTQLERIFNHLKANTIKRYSIYILFFVPALWTVYYLHPDYFSYYNPMFGGLKVGIQVLEPKWLIGEREIIKYFDKVKTDQDKIDFQPGENIDRVTKENLEQRLVIGFEEKYYTQIWPFVIEMGAWPIIQDLTPYATKANYFVYPIWEDNGVNENRFEIKKIDTIQIRGVDLYNVYER